MKILAFADHLTATSSGGAERMAAEVYARLAAVSGVRLTVVTVLPPGHEPLVPTGADVEVIEGRDLSQILGAELLLGRGLKERVQRLHESFRPDVLHANGLHFHSSVAAGRLARRHGTPLVTTAHLGGLSALGLRLRAGGTLWDRTLGRTLACASDRVVAVSAAVAEHVRSLGVRQRRLTVAPNGVDHGRFRPRSRDSLGSGNQLNAVLVGRLIANKGPAVAIEAVALARRAGARVALTVVGDGPLRSRLERQAGELGLLDHVRFVGHTDDVAPYLQLSDVLLRPTYTEGLPLAVLEAMASGLPVVCSDIPGNTEVVEHRVNGWHVPAGDAAATALALADLDADRDLLRRLGEAASITAGGYTWERSAEIHGRTLRSAAAAGGYTEPAVLSLDTPTAATALARGMVPSPSRPVTGEPEAASAVPVGDSDAGTAPATGESDAGAALATEELHTEATLATSEPAAGAALAAGEAAAGDPVHATVSEVRTS